MDSRRRLDRRNFITLSTAAAVASLVFGCSKKRTVSNMPQPLLDPSAQTVSQGEISSVVEATSGEGSCMPTSADITGPFWRKGIPVRHDFDLFDDEGQKLTLMGRVLDGKCQPVPQAVVEMWHASPTSLAVDQLSSRDAVDYDVSSPAFRYYGQFATDSAGRYEMRTKKPGWYLNGRTFRPSHIHVKVYVDGLERLTTQLYFKGDPFIPKDPWASQATERLVTTVPSHDGGLLGRFDFSVVTS